MTRTTMLVVAGVLCSLSSACAVQQPTARLDGARLTGLSPTKMNVDLDFDVDNPNEFDLPVSAVTWDLKLWQDPFADGTVGLDDRLPALGQAKVPVPLSVSLKRAASGLAKILAGKKIPYNVAGDLQFSSPFGSVSVPYNKAGSWENPLSLLGLL